MKEIPAVTQEEKELSDEWEQERNSTDLERLNALQEGHRAFLECVITENFAKGKTEIANALFLFPHPTVWRLFCLVIAMDEGIREARKTFLESINFYARRNHRGADALIKITFNNRYESPAFFVKNSRSDGLTEDGVNFLRQYSDIFSHNANLFSDYGDAIRNNGGKYEKIGDFIEDFANKAIRIGFPLS